MSVPSPFFLRSNNGTGEVYFCVDGHTVTEICLFSTKIYFEQYPMEVKWLSIKSGIWAVKEISAEQFEQAKQAFFQKVGLLPPVAPAPAVEKEIPAFLTTPISPAPLPQNGKVPQALNGISHSGPF